MQIDWITVVAQLTNFLILVWLLNRFLFKPVMKLMAERESLIESRLRDATVESKKAQLALEEHVDAKAELEVRKNEILTTAISLANEEQQRLLETARKDIEERRISWLKNLDDEKLDARNAYRYATASSTRLLTDALLRKISNASLNEQMISSFLEQLEDLDPTVISKLKNENNALTIVSAIDLNSTSKQTLTGAINGVAKHMMTIDYKVDKDLIAGVQLTANGVCLDWNLQNMLQAMDSQVLEALETANDREN
jgi:F-type H+-transporting ATPase subunit b